MTAPAVNTPPPAPAPEPGPLTLIRQDLARTTTIFTGSRLGVFIECVRQPGVLAVMTFRLGHWLTSQGLLTKIVLKPLYMLLDHHARAQWGIQIQDGARIAGGFHIHHFGGIFVSGYAVIGENFTLGHDVTIGAGGEGARRGAPHIGSNVVVGSGAKLYGKVQIGSNVKIAPNSVIDKNIPDNVIVHPAPVQVIRFPGLTGPAETAAG